MNDKHSNPPYISNLIETTTVVHIFCDWNTDKVVHFTSLSPRITKYFSKNSQTTCWSSFQRNYQMIFQRQFQRNSWRDCLRKFSKNIFQGNVKIWKNFRRIFQRNIRKNLKNIFKEIINKVKFQRNSRNFEALPKIITKEGIVKGIAV